jgi:hypothetical protein
MSKLLKMLEDSSLAGVRGASRTGQSTYVSPVPRVALGFAGVAMAVITIAVSVILPARYDAGNPEAPVQLASQTTSSASNSVGAIMSITVVAAREPRSSTVPLRMVEAAPRPEPVVEMAPSAIFRVSSAAQ